MENIFYVYAYLRSTDNTPYYIGKGKGNRAWSKTHNVTVPTDKSKIVLLQENMSDSEAKELEIKLISEFGRKDLGTGILRNLTNGGEGCSGRILSDETKQKLRKPKPAGFGQIIASKRLGIPHTQDRINNISANRKGMPAWNKGITWSDETKQKMRKPKNKVSCPHCKLLGGSNNMYRYHFDNCKQKGEE
jgi:hypothetical protein